LLDLFTSPMVPEDLEKLMTGLEHELASLHKVLAGQVSQPIGGKGSHGVRGNGSHKAAANDPYGQVVGDSSAHDVVYKVITAQSNRVCS
jgi:hypothetical protein